MDTLTKEHQAELTTLKVKIGSLSVKNNELESTLEASVSLQHNEEMKLRSLSQAVIILRQENEDLKSSLEATIEFEMKVAERYEASTPKSD